MSNYESIRLDGKFQALESYSNYQFFTGYAMEAEGKSSLWDKVKRFIKMVAAFFKKIFDAIKGFFAKLFKGKKPSTNNNNKRKATIRRNSGTNDKVVHFNEPSIDKVIMDEAWGIDRAYAAKISNGIKLYNTFAIARGKIITKIATNKLIRNKLSVVLKELADAQTTLLDGVNTMNDEIDNISTSKLENMMNSANKPYHSTTYIVWEGPILSDMTIEWAHKLEEAVLYNLNHFEKQAKLLDKIEKLDGGFLANFSADTKYLSFLGKCVSSTIRIWTMVGNSNAIVSEVPTGGKFRSDHKFSK